MLAGQAPVSGHLSPTPLVAAYENHSRRRPAPVADTVFRVPRVSAYDSFDCTTKQIKSGYFTLKRGFLKISFLIYLKTLLQIFFKRLVNS